MNFYIIGAVAFAAFFSGWMVNGWRLDAEISKIHEENATATAAATTAAMQETERLQRIKDAALKEAAKRARENAAAASAARTERDGLQSQLAAATTALSNSTCDASREYGTTVSNLFQQCTGRLTDVAEKADGHATDARTLSDAWPKEGITNATK